MILFKKLTSKLQKVTHLAKPFGIYKPLLTHSKKTENNLKSHY